MIREGSATVGVTACSGFQSLTVDVTPRDCLGRARTERSVSSPENQVPETLPQPLVAQDSISRTTAHHGLVTEEENGERHAGGKGLTL